MHFSLQLGIAVLSLMSTAAAVPINAERFHKHAFHKRDVVTEWVEASVTVTQNRVVYVNQDGSLLSVITKSTTADSTTASSSAAPIVSTESSSSTSQAQFTSVLTTLAKQLKESSVEQTTTSSSSVAPTTTVEKTITPTSSSATTIEVTSSSSSSSSTYVEPTTTSEAESTTTTSEASTVVSSTAAAASSSSSSSTFSGDGTYYSPGLGACGDTNSDSDYIVAISEDLFDTEATANPNNNPFCGRKIKASRNGASVEVTVVDRCTGCALHDLDFSPSAFDNLGEEAEGRITIDWEWIS